MVLYTVLLECKIPSYEPDHITTFIMSPLCNKTSLPLYEGRYRNEKAKLRKSYRKSVSLSLIGHGTLQTSNGQCFEGNKRTQEAAWQTRHIWNKNTKMNLMVGCGFETFSTQIWSTAMVGSCEYNRISDEKIKANYFTYEKAQVTQQGRCSI